MVHLSLALPVRLRSLGFIPSYASLLCHFVIINLAKIDSRFGRKVWAIYGPTLRLNRIYYEK